MQEAIFSNFDSLPALLSTKDLVKIGLYNSIDAAYLARLKGKSPDFIKIERKILYKKEDIIKFIKKYIQKGERSEDCHEDCTKVTKEK